MAKKKSYKYSDEEYQMKVEYYSNLKNTISINNGNEKTGKACLTISMPPALTCRPDAPCYSLCYGRKGHMAFPRVCGAYYRNHRLWQEDPIRYEQMLDACLTTYNLPLLRINDTGDLVSLEYFEMLCRVIKNHPEIKAMVFTKKYDIVNEYLNNNELPENFCVRFSAWDKNWKIDNPHNLPMAYVDFKDSSINPEIPKNAFLCKGGKEGVTCSNCRMCFNKKVQAIRLLEH